MSERPRPSWQQLATEAASVVGAADAEGVAARVVGSTGIHLHCSSAAAAIEGAARGCKDIDLIVRRSDRKRIRALLEGRGYEVDRDVLVVSEGSRFIFSHPETGIDIDVFVDKMEFSHTIDLSERLELHERTIPIEDLLLQKLQVHDLTRNDVLDAAVLLSTHRVQAGGEGEEEIDCEYVAAVLARDWGFHRTATENLVRVEEAVAAEDLVAGSEQVRAGAGALREAIEAAPKSRGWRLRARVGERMQWWNDVDDPHGAY